MISDEERREIADGLRRLAGGRHGTAVPDSEILDVLGISAADTPNRSDTRDVEILADIIDRPTTTRHGKFKTKYGSEVPCCEVCGYSIGDTRWNYCPKCGAEVVE